MKKIKALSFLALTAISLHGFAIDDFSKRIPFGDQIVKPFELISAYTRLIPLQKMDIICQVRAANSDHPAFYVNLASVNLVPNDSGSPDGYYSLVSTIPITVIKYNVAAWDYESDTTLRFNGVGQINQYPFIVSCKMEPHI